MRKIYIYVTLMILAVLIAPGWATSPYPDTCSTSSTYGCLAGNNTWTKGQAVSPFALTDAATIAVDASQSNSFTVTLGGNRTLGNPTNLIAGETLTFQVTQGTGGQTLAYSSDFKWPGGTAPTLSTGAAAVDVISCKAWTTSFMTCLSGLNFQ